MDSALGDSIGSPLPLLSGCENEHGFVGDPRSVSTKKRILAYLGQLKAGEFIPVRKLIYDLSLRFTTAKNALTSLEEEWIVEKRIVNNRGTVAEFRISPTASCGVKDNKMVLFVPPEWEASYGRHPYGF